MKNLNIKSLAYYIPDGRMQNNTILEKVKETNKDTFNPLDLDDLIYNCRRKLEFLGIETRAYSTNLEEDNILTMAVKAARKTLEKSKLKPENIDCVIMVGISNPFREPSAACMIAHFLNIRHTDYFDINDTCNGFMKAIEISGLYIDSGKYTNILIVASENPLELEKGYQAHPAADSIEDFNNRMSNLIVGAGAAAMILSKDGKAKQIMGYKEKKETKNWDASLFRVPDTMLPKTKWKKEIQGFWSDARLISLSIIKEMPDFIKECLQHWNLKKEDIDICILHQLGNNITFATLDKLKLKHEKAPINTFKELGNMANANIPVNLSIAEEKGYIKSGDNVILLCSACGLTYSVTYIKW